mmetsp:Transcript_32093/g.73852  ORF Transcript_32093/g.73852 Transcript_32093/m.73852 type:complete len:81 (+) Transcript_32093:367-609(+)
MSFLSFLSEIYVLLVSNIVMGLRAFFDDDSMLIDTFSLPGVGKFQYFRKLDEVEFIPFQSFSTKIKSKQNEIDNKFLGGQ